MHYKVNTNDPRRGTLTTLPGTDQLYLTIYYPVVLDPCTDMVSGIQPSVARKKHLPLSRPATTTRATSGLPELPPPCSKFEVTQEEISMAENLKHTTPYVNPAGPLPDRVYKPQLTSAAQLQYIFNKPVAHSTPFKDFDSCLVLANLSPVAPVPFKRPVSYGAGSPVGGHKKPKL